MSLISSSGGYRKRMSQNKGEHRDTFYLRTHFQFDDLYLVCYYRWFAALVKSGVEHLNCITVELIGEARPVECERHEEVPGLSLHHYVRRGLIQSNNIHFYPRIYYSTKMTIIIIPDPSLLHLLRDHNTGSTTAFQENRSISQSRDGNRARV